MGAPTTITITDSNGHSLTITGATSGAQLASPVPCVLTDVNGNVLTLSTGGGGGSGSAEAIQSASANATVSFSTAFNVLVLATAGAGGITLTLPDATACSGQIVRVIQVDTGAGGVTINTVSSQIIGYTGGLTSLELTQQEQCLSIESTGSRWVIISQNY